VDRAAHHRFSVNDCANPLPSNNRSLSSLERVDAQVPVSAPSSPKSSGRSASPDGDFCSRGSAGGRAAGTTLLTAAIETAEQTGKHVSSHSARRGRNPRGSNDKSEHRVDLGGNSAFDFHLFDDDGTQVPDGEVKGLILKTGGMPRGTRLIQHTKGTNTEGEHLHVDQREEVGNRTETGGVYKPMRR
jgi:hypothetical protein